MTSDIDLWTGTFTETGDEAWVAYTYKDDAVQFIKKDTHAMVWQGRTVVSEEFSGGRIEAHYSHSTDLVFLVAATGLERPPKHEQLLDTDEFIFDPDALETETLEFVLRTLLAEWVVHHQMSKPPYPSHDALSELTDLTSGTARQADDKPFEDRTSQEILDVGVANIKASNRTF